MQNRMLNPTDVLVHAATTGRMRSITHPIVRAIRHHLLGIRRIAVAHEIPRRIHKRIHRVRLTSRSLATHRTRHTMVKADVLVERITRTIRNTVLRQNDRQIFFRHRHRTMLIAMDDGNRCAPITLTRNTPVAQTPSSFLFAQTSRSQISRHRIDTSPKSKPIVLARIDSNATTLFCIPVLPHRVIKRQSLCARASHRRRTFQTQRGVGIRCAG